MLELVISGGQTGVDQAGWIAAKRHGIPTGGWMPKGYLTEDGCRPDFATTFGAWQHESRDYRPRTKDNVIESQATIWLGYFGSAGYRLTERTADEHGKPFLVSFTVPYYGRWSRPTRSPEVLARMIAEEGWTVINVAGNRESKYPGIGVWATMYLSKVFRILTNQEIPSDHKIRCSV